MREQRLCDFGQSTLYGRGMSRTPTKATNVSVFGELRTVKCLGHADTFFSIPASVKVRGKLMKGFLTQGDEGLDFTADDSSLPAPPLTFDAPPIPDYEEEE